MVQHTQLTDKQISGIFKDYTEKILPKINKYLLTKNAVNISANDINNLVVLLNWCFLLKNNFFIKDFNKRLVFAICDAYNQLKTNILSPDDNMCILDNIDIEKLKTMKFILHQYVSIIDTLQEDTYYTDLCKTVTKASIKKCLAFVNGFILTK